MKRSTSLASEAARAKLASLARQTTEDIDRRQTVPLPAEKVRQLVGHCGFDLVPDVDQIEA